MKKAIEGIPTRHNVQQSWSAWILLLRSNFILYQLIICLFVLRRNEIV